MPTSPDCVTVLGQHVTLNSQFRRGESVFIATGTAPQVPTAESLSLAKVHVRRMWVIVRKDENAISPQRRCIHFIVRKQRGHS
jgi:hypothetical protein